MKIHRLLPIRRPFAQAFTLIELLVVISIIALLAALSIGAFTMAMQTSARNRTTATLHAVVSALERYKEKNGEYPEPSGSVINQTDKFGDMTLNTGGAQMLYQAITGDGNDAINIGNGAATSSTGAVTDANKEFVINGDFIPTKDLTTGTFKSKLNSTTVTSDNKFLIMDGFGHPFQYTKAPVAVTGTPATTVNPTYDVWSFANATSADGVTSDLATKQDSTKNAAWIKNW